MSVCSICAILSSFKVAVVMMFRIFDSIHTVLLFKSDYSSSDSHCVAYLLQSFRNIDLYYDIGNVYQLFCYYKIFPALF